MDYQNNINVMSKGSLIRQDNLFFLKDAIFIALRAVCSKWSEITQIDPAHQILFLTKPFFCLILHSNYHKYSNGSVVTYTVGKIELPLLFVFNFLLPRNLFGLEKLDMYASESI